MLLETDSLRLLAEGLKTLEEGFDFLPPAGAAKIPGAARMAAVMEETAKRLHDNYPYFHPYYAGQMLKPPHPLARAAYALAT